MIVSYTFNRKPGNAFPEGWCNIGYRHDTHLKIKSREISFAQKLSLSYKIVFNFAQIMAVWLVCSWEFSKGSQPCSVQIVKMNWQLKSVIWTSKISPHFSFRCVFGGYSVLKQPPIFRFNIPWDMPFLNTSMPRQRYCHSTDDIVKLIFFDETYEFRLRFHWNLFLSFEWIISQHWFR